jgi:hypothetical protein
MSSSNQTEPESQSSQIGLQYQCSNGIYQDPNATLERDFSRFEHDGIKVLVFGITWYRIEGPTEGDYNGTYSDGTPYGNAVLDGVKRFIQIAAEYHIGAVVSFYSIWGNDGLWCTPQYVVDPVTGLNDELSIVRSPQMRQAFVNMFTYTVKYLAKTPNIVAWDILGEPWYWPTALPAPYNNIDQKENFITLIGNLSAVVKEYDGRPVSIPFVSDHEYGTAAQAQMENLFLDNFGWDPRLLDALSFITFSTSLPTAYPTLETEWFNMTRLNVETAVSYGKQVWIEGIGSPANDDANQTSDYVTQINFLKTLPIEGFTCWCWWIDPLNVGTAWNLLNDTQGNPRPAYYALTNSSGV